jgi:3-phenylpropionate/trans-cinnamate dioxygenase ferredoxin subunit
MVRTYEVSIAAGAQLQKGPYVAETYPVSVEQEYVLVEIGR